MYKKERKLKMTELQEKRMAGEYEVFQAISVGLVEIVMGDNPNAEPEERYMCAICTSNDLFAQYRDIYVSEDYAEILELYGQRVAGEAEKLLNEVAEIKEQGIDDTPLTDAGFQPLSPEDDLNGKVVVIRADVLKKEYQRATRQLQLVTGGFGASPNSRGTACYCKNLYSGKQERFERWDVLGIVDRENLPDWAKDGLRRIEQERKRDKEAR